MSKSMEDIYRDHVLSNANEFELIYLAHHGILGQKWGVRRYQNKDGTRTSAGKKQEKDEREKSKGVSDAIDSLLNDNRELHSRGLKESMKTFDERFEKNKKAREYIRNNNKTIAGALEKANLLSERLDDKNISESQRDNIVKQVNDTMNRAMRTYEKLLRSRGATDKEVKELLFDADTDLWSHVYNFGY